MFGKFSEVMGILLAIVLLGTLVTSAFAQDMDIVDTAVADGVGNK